MSEHLRASRVIDPKESPRLFSSPAASAVARPATQSGGQTLDRRTQNQMSARFGHKFSQVRIHADSHAEKSAQALGANAFTVGEDIVFGPGKYQPGSRETERLLAHELTHVVQQRRWGAGDASRMSQRGDSSEREADSLADAVVAGQAVQVSAAPGAAIARDEDATESPWKSFTDNPIWNIGTHDTVGAGMALGVNKLDPIAEEAKNASIFSDMNMQQFRFDHPELTPLGPESSAAARAAQQEGWNMNSVEEATMREAEGPMLPIGQSAEEGEEALQNASRWETPLKGLGALKFAGRVASPFSLYGDTKAMVNDWEKGEHADAVADGLGVTSAAIGTVDALGAGATFLGAAGAGGAISSVASTLNPVGAVAGAGAGGYALGKYGLGKANNYAKNHDLFGEGRDTTEAAADAGTAVRDFFGDGVFGDVAGGLTAIGSSWGTAAYSGLHAAGGGIKDAGSWLWDHTLGDSGPSDEEMAANQKQADAVMSENMDNMMNAEEDEELNGPSVSVAHDDAPPPPRSH